jgi:hypothetical protein
MALTKPPVKNVWADAGDIVTPLDAELLVGWPNVTTPPARERFNWVLNFLSNGVRYLTRRGIADWANDENYLINDYVRGSDGLSYRALTNNINKAPQTNLVDWIRWGFSALELLGFGFSTGDVKLTYKTVADATWIMASDLSIGSAASGATGRANADTQTLYELLWANIPNQYAPVTGGRGATSTLDFNANKPLFIAKALGRALAIAGTVASGVNADVDTTLDSLAVLTNTDAWITGMPVTFTLASGTITGLTSGNQYFVFRASSTSVKLCSTLANAQNGVVIDLTAKSTPVWSITYFNVVRGLGEHGGENQHAESSIEQLAHVHGAGSVNSGASAAGTDTLKPGGAINTTTTGGNAAMNITQPSTFMNAMIKL